MTEWTCHTESIEQTQSAGVALAALLRPGDTVVLTGPLGAGKTALTQGIARALGVRERVTSPTFTMVRQHVCHNSQGIEVLHHADLYRTNSLDEIADLTLDEMVTTGGVAVVEWGEMGDPLWPPTIVRLSIQPTSDTSRTLTVELDAAREPSSDVWSRR
ncbi:MAG: tRNA (adenosine(37)-N6)-threonylcarbamoyltransferase complex ATPase subunit type 1 TsaE [Acidobacteria bacterium]|nr:tRNA (adenosine(37)-N6)-threonylcarbamoyltransferase complex ATPase subunit type 1 TsaE [Acidobacteriota bacterium]